MGCGGSKKDVPDQAHSDNPHKKDSHAESQPSAALPAEKNHEETAKPQVKEQNPHAAHKEEKKPLPEEHKSEKPEDHQAAKKEEHKPENHEEHKVDKHNDHADIKEEHKVDKHEGHHADKHEEPKVPEDHEPKPAGKKPDQAGGHSGSLIARGDKLLKKAGPKEKAFYKYLFSDECTDPSLIDLRSIVPHYFGTEDIDGKTYMVLENLLTG